MNGYNHNNHNHHNSSHHNHSNNYHHLNGELREREREPPLAPPPGTVVMDQPVDEDEPYNNPLLMMNQSSSNNNEDYYYDASNYYGSSNLCGRNISWDYKSVTLTRVPGYGFGIAVSGGSDNPHFANGDPSIAISDVLKGGPAEGKLNINDRILSANGTPLSNVDYATAVAVLRDSGPTVNLIIKRRIVATKINLTKLTSTKPKNVTSDDYGLKLSIKVVVKESRVSGIEEGDEIVTANGVDITKLWDIRKVISKDDSQGGSQLSVGVVKKQMMPNQGQQAQGPNNSNVRHAPERSWDSQGGNLYVQPPTRKNKEKDHRNQNLNESNELLLPPPPRPPLPVSPPPPPMEKQPTRFVNFIKKANTPLGLKLVGGNNVGIYIGAILNTLPHELSPGDLILRVNDTNLQGVTREVAIQTLTSLPPDSLVSFAVRNVPNWRDILSAEQYHDLVYLRLLRDYEGIRKGSVVLVYDTCGQGGGYEGLLLSEGQRMKAWLPNKKNFEYKEVRKGRVKGTRPIVLAGVGKLTEWVGRGLDDKTKGAKRRFKFVEDIPELESLCKTQINTHGVITASSFDQLLHLLDYCPLVILVKTEDRNIVKKLGSYGSNYGSLLRSFNHKTNGYTSRTQKLLDETSRIEKDMGSWIDKVISLNSTEGIDVLGREIESIFFHNNEYWVGVTDQEMMMVYNQDDQSNPNRSPSRILNGHSTSSIISTPITPRTPHRERERNSRDSSRDRLSQNDSLLIPNYNLPPPHSIHTNNHTPIYHPVQNQLVPQPVYQQPPSHPANSSSKQNQHHPRLVHTPELGNNENEPPPPPPPLIPPPTVDRTKKPGKGSTPLPLLPGSSGVPIVKPRPTPPPKPAPPPKPLRPPTAKTPDDDYNNCYLNLPMNSKLFGNSNSIDNASSSSPSSSSAFRPYNGGSSTSKLPLIQDNTTTGTFTSSGGILRQRNVKPGEIPIELYIPEGAIQEGRCETVWFHVIGQEQKKSLVDGEMLSPLVKFGPEGLIFRRPVEIRMPQYHRRGMVRQASVHMSNGRSGGDWDKIEIKGDGGVGEEEVKIVSLTVQRF